MNDLERIEDLRKQLIEAKDERDKYYKTGSDLQMELAKSVPISLLTTERTLADGLAGTIKTIWDAKEECGDKLSFNWLHDRLQEALKTYQQHRGE